MSINYSGLQLLEKSTLQSLPARIYVMGINPGVDDSNARLDELEPQEDRYWSAYTDQCWHDHEGRGGCSRLGESPHQKEVRALIRAIHPELGANDVFGTNAIFAASGGIADFTSVEFDALWQKCWPVHQRLLTIFEPQLIVCLGNAQMRSAFALLKSAGPDQWEETRSIGRLRNTRTYQWKAAEAKLRLERGILRTTVLALPHPSRFPGLASHYQQFISESSLGASWLEGGVLSSGASSPGR